MHIHWVDVVIELEERRCGSEETVNEPVFCGWTESSGNKTPLHLLKISKHNFIRKQILSGIQTWAAVEAIQI